MHTQLSTQPVPGGAAALALQQAEKSARAEPMPHLLQGPARTETWEGVCRRALQLGSLGFFSICSSVVLGVHKVIFTNQHKQQGIQIYKYADFGGPEVFVTVTACLFKLLENNYLFLFSPVCRVLSECLLLASTLINWLSLLVRVFTENQT